MIGINLKTVVTMIEELIHNRFCGDETESEQNEIIVKFIKECIKKQWALEPCNLHDVLAGNFAFLRSVKTTPHMSKKYHEVVRSCVVNVNIDILKSNVRDKSHIGNYGQLVNYLVLQLNLVTIDELEKARDDHVIFIVSPKHGFEYYDIGDRVK